jgi:UDPglucose 6-dehydrogenase
MEAAARVLHSVTLCKDPYQVAEGADALVLATEWNEFKHLDFERIRQMMRTPVIVDGRNLWDPERLRALGFTYFGVGRGVSSNHE